MTLLGNRPKGAPAGHEPASELDAEFWTQIVRRVEQGDGDAEADLISRFEPRIRMMASSRLRGADLARDITHETLVAVLKAVRGGSVREPDKLPAFVFGVARNLINNHFREAARRVEIGGDPPDYGNAASEAGVVYAEAERRQMIRDCLPRLNPLDRRILLLTLVDGLSPREIAPIVGLTPEVVRTRKSRAVQAVRNQIQARDTKAAAKPQK